MNPFFWNWLEVWHCSSICQSIVWHPYSQIVVESWRVNYAIIVHQAAIIHLKHEWFMILAKKNISQFWIWCTICRLCIASYNIWKLSSVPMHIYWHLFCDGLFSANHKHMDHTAVRLPLYLLNFVDLTYAFASWVEATRHNRVKPQAVFGGYVTNDTWQGIIVSLTGGAYHPP